MAEVEPKNKLGSRRAYIWEEPSRNSSSLQDGHNMVSLNQNRSSAQFQSKIEQLPQTAGRHRCKNKYFLRSVRLMRMAAWKGSRIPFLTSLQRQAQQKASQWIKLSAVMQRKMLEMSRDRFTGESWFYKNNLGGSNFVQFSTESNVSLFEVFCDTYSSECNHFLASRSSWLW